MPTRLKRLDLHGFKSFATPTTFLFDPGLTAVIGPNGSGKSNIADAMRWVLGEQSYANLRGRRTEDVVFAGSSARSPLGMAEVTLTLDNESGELPLPFSEISVTRRAYRSGENQYLLNGARVRLKDILQVTASLGQAYTVIGQGLVDAVLSQRPDERNGLFEHAAGITGLRLKHAEAERHLTESTANSTRLADLLGEIEPRLRTLERAAKQARDFSQVREQLQVALRRSFALQWRTASERLRQAESEEADATRRLAEGEEEERRATAALESAEQATSWARLGSDAAARALDECRAALRDAEHRLALVCERRAAQERSAEELAKRFEALQATATSLDAEQEQTRAERASVGHEIDAVVAEIGRLEAADADVRRQRAKVEALLAEVDQARAKIERELAATEAQGALLDRRQHDLGAERERLTQAATRRGERMRELAAQSEAARVAAVEARQEAEQLTERRACLEEKLGATSSDRTAIEHTRAALDRRLVQASTRLEALQRLRDSGAGLYAGTKAVLEHARAGRLAGVLGALASLIEVPSELEGAIEAALGGHLQDIVVERWADAEAAIQRLKRDQSGRATFQPLDTVHAGQAARPPRLTAKGVRGVAADLIDGDPRIKPIIQGLLGRVIVVDDLLTTRTVLPSLPPGWSIVTLAGEITRSSGAVTGGARAKESGALARERELRELPDQCRGLEKELASARSRLDALARDISRLTNERATLNQALGSAREAQRAAEAQTERLERRRADLEEAAAEEGMRRRELDERDTALAAERRALSDSRDVAQALQSQHLIERRRLAEQLTAIEQASRGEQAHAARAELSALRERARGLDDRLGRLDRQRERLLRERRDLDASSAGLDAERSRLAAEQATLEEARDDAVARLREAERCEGPARAALTEAIEAEQTERRLLAECEASRRDAERERDRLALDAARRRDERELLEERARRELEVDHIAGLLEALPIDETGDPASLQREIGRLRERLRRIGMAPSDAVEQYEREAERYTYLRGQLDDVQAGADALRALLTELTRSMASEFDRALAEVGAAFSETFTSLFGGGKARLVRAGEQGEAVGVEILAQPPGKRLQNLSLLSGGERALTAVALLFAILKVNPSPFCLLDEVDAALDEANVVRVRDELRALSVRTQFVVVTHNRATIEGADTLYGITMGDDGLSRVLSLRLPAEATT